MTPKDVYNAVDGYAKSKAKLKNDKKIKAENRKLFIKFLDAKEEDLKAKKGGEAVDKIRYSKTLRKHIFMLRAVDSFFNKALKNITESDMKKVRDKLIEGKIKSSKKKPYSKDTLRDFQNKVFKGKSGFFEFIGKAEIAQKVFKLEKGEGEEVRFFDKKSLDLMCKCINPLTNRLLLYLLFDSGIRIGTILNLKVGDFDKRLNIDTKMDYYLVHVRKDYTKSKRDRTISLLITETNDLLDVVLKDREKGELLFPFGYSNAVKIIRRASKRAKVKTKPDGKDLAVHDFRRSCATHFLSKGYSIDFVKARLGHKPSSSVVDKYVSYLGLKEEKAVTQAQSLDYNSLKVAHKENAERVKVLDENIKTLKKQFEDFQKRAEIVTLAKKAKQSVQKL